MTYVQHRFTEFEEDLIEKYFPSIGWVEERTCCKYILDPSDNIDFSRQFCQMMYDPDVKSGTSKIDFWVIPGQLTFTACPGNGARNIWEYYLYTCKELSK